MLQTCLGTPGGRYAEEPPHVWVDQLSRGLLESGEFGELLTHGVTGANISARAVAAALGRRADLAEDVRDLDAAGLGPVAICETLLSEDIRDAADELQEIHQASDSHTGCVSTDGPWLLAEQTDDVLRLALHLWTRVARPNVMLNMPVSDAVIAAVPHLLAAGVSINLTSVSSTIRLQQAWRVWHQAIRAIPAGRTPPAFGISVVPFRVGELIDQRIGGINGLPDWAPAWRLVGRTGPALAAAISAMHMANRENARRLLPGIPAHALPRLHWLYDPAECGCEDPMQCIGDIPFAHGTLVLPPSLLLRWIHGPRQEVSAVAVDDRFDAELSALGISMDRLASEIESRSVEEGVSGGLLLDRSIAAACERRV